MTFSDENKCQSVEAFAAHADITFTKALDADPEARSDGHDHRSREVRSGHYVPVRPTPIEGPVYVAHSERFFRELGLSDELAKDEKFMRIFSGDLSAAPEQMGPLGWATGYALSIYGREYYEQCPFGTGNGYGDGRAISIFEGVFGDKRREFQLKGAGRTPYCRGADGRAVLRSSVREFLAQEHMHALGVPTTRSLTLYASRSETVKRPWFRPGSRSYDPDVMQLEPVAITTRVASSFLRVGQLELFGRRARKGEHPRAMEELERIVRYAIEREYGEEVDREALLSEQVLSFAEAFGERLASLVANWIRVGYCQGNFNSDNCAVGGFTLDYGPFGFIDSFDPRYQPWTGGGAHFCFFNQPRAAERNFTMFCHALAPLLRRDEAALKALESIHLGFGQTMKRRIDEVWAQKLGMERLDDALLQELFELMMETTVDYTIFFRQLSQVPETIEILQPSFYTQPDSELLGRWAAWLKRWHEAIPASIPEERAEVSRRMKRTNPKYTLREWLLVPAYQRAEEGDYTLLRELQQVMERPYDEQSEEVEAKYYRKKPEELFDVAGVSFVSCSS